MLIYAKKKANTLIDDEITVRKLGAITKYFDALKNSSVRVYDEFRLHVQRTR